MDEIPTYLSRIYHSAWSQQSVVRKGRKVASIALFTVDGSTDKILYAGAITDERTTVFVFVSGQEVLGHRSILLDPAIPGYSTLNIVTQRHAISDLLDRCDLFLQNFQAQPQPSPFL